MAGMAGMRYFGDSVFGRARTKVRVRPSFIVSVVLMAALAVAGLVLFAPAIQAQTDRTTVHLVQPGAAGAIDLSDYVTAKTTLGGKLSTGSPALIAWPGADDLSQPLVYSNARFTFHDDPPTQAQDAAGNPLPAEPATTGTIVITRDDAPALSALTSDSMDIMLVLDWNEAGPTGTDGDLGSATLGVRGNFGFTASNKTVTISGEIVASECIAGDCSDPAAGKLALLDETESALAPQAVVDFFGARDLEGTSVGRGVSFVGSTALANVVGDLATDEAASLAVDVSGSLEMETGKFISSGTLDTSVKSFLRGSVEAENMALPKGLDASTFVFSMIYEPALAGNPGTDEKLTIAAEGSITIAALEATDEDGNPVPAMVGVTISISPSGAVSIGAKYDGGYTWTIPGTTTPLTVESLALAMSVGDSPSITASASVVLDGVAIFASIEVIEETVNNLAVTTTTISIGFQEATLQQIANVAGSVAGTDIALPSELASVQLSATAFFEVEGNDVSLWLEGTVTVGSSSFGVGFFAEPGGGGLFSLQFSSEVTLGELMPNAELGETYASIPLPTGGVVISDMPAYNGFDDASPLPGEAMEFLAPIYGCADVSACAGQNIETGLKFFGNIKLPSLDNSLQALWITPGSTFQVSGSLPIFGAAKPLPAGAAPDTRPELEPVSLTVKLPTIAPSTNAQIQSAPWFVGLDFEFTIAQEAAELSFLGSGKLTALIPDETEGQTLAALLPNDPTRTQRGSGIDRFDMVTAIASAEFKAGAKEVSFTLTGTITGANGQPWESPFGATWLSISAATVQLKIDVAPDPGVQLGVRFKAEIGGVLVDASAAIKVGPGTPVKIGAGFRLYMDRLALRDVLVLAEEFGLDGVDPNNAPPLVFKNVELMFSTIDSETLCLDRGIIIGVDVYLEESGSTAAASMGGDSAALPEDTDATTCAGAQDRPEECDGDCLGSGRLEILETGLLLDIGIRSIDFGPVEIVSPKLKIEANENAQGIEISGGVKIEGFLEADGLLKLGSDGMRVRVRVQDEDKKETFLIDASAAFDGPGGLPSAFTLEIEIVSETLGDVSQGVTQALDDALTFFGADDAVDVIRVTCMSLTVSVGQSDSLDSEDLVNDGGTKTLANGVHGDLHWVAFENGTDADLGINGQPKKVAFTWDFDESLVDNLEGLADLGTPVTDLGGGCGMVPDWDVFGAQTGLAPGLFEASFIQHSGNARHLNCHPGRGLPFCVAGAFIDQGGVTFNQNADNTNEVSISGNGFPIESAQATNGVATVRFRHLFNTPGFGSYYVRLEQVDRTVSRGDGHSHQKVVATLNGEVIGTEVDLDLHMANGPGLVQVRARVFDMEECDSSNLLATSGFALIQIESYRLTNDAAQASLEACTLNHPNAEGLTVSDRFFSVYLFNQPVSGPMVVDSPQTVIFEGENFDLAASYTHASGLDPNDYFVSFITPGGADRRVSQAPGGPFGLSGEVQRGEFIAATTLTAIENSDSGAHQLEVRLSDQSGGSTAVVGSEQVFLNIANRAPYMNEVSVGNNLNASIRPQPALPLFAPSGITADNDWEALSAAPWQNDGPLVLNRADMGDEAAGTMLVRVFAWDPGLKDTQTAIIGTSDGAVTEVAMAALTSGGSATGEHNANVQHQFANGVIPENSFELSITLIDDDGGQSAVFTRQITLVRGNDAVQFATPVVDNNNDGVYYATGTTFGATDQSGNVSDSSLDAFGPSFSDQCVVWFTFDDPNNLARLGENYPDGQRNWFDIEVRGRSQRDWEPTTFAVTMPRGNGHGGVTGSANQAIQLFDIPFSDGGDISPGEPTERFYSLGWVDQNRNDPVRVTFGVYTPGGCNDGGAASGPFEVLIEGRGPTNDFQFEGGFNADHDLGASPIVLTEQVNLYANVEQGEPELPAAGAESNPDSTVWYQFDSDYTYARYRVETTDTNTGLLGGLPALDTKLGVYVGPDTGSQSDFADLVALGINDDKSGSRKSRVLADPGDTGIATGDRLWVQVAGYDGGEGMFDLEVEALTSPATSAELGFVPQLILDRHTLSNGFNGSNVGPATHTMIYTAQHNGLLDIVTSGAGFGSVTVTDPALLDPVGAPVGSDGWRAPVRFGQSYLVTFTGNDGDFRFDASLVVTEHDRVEDALVIALDTSTSLRTGTLAGDSDNSGGGAFNRSLRNGSIADGISSREPGEPFHAGLASTDHSVWASFSPTAGVTYDVFTTLADFDTVIAVYEGADVENLVALAANDDFEGGSLDSRVQFTSSSGDPVLIALAGYDHTWGSANLRIVEAVNDTDGDGLLDEVDGCINTSPGLIATINPDGCAPGDFFCDGEPATILGTNGPDTLPGTAGDDVIVGRGGVDTINAGAGNDVVCANGGNDVVNGGPGDDVILGGEGNDRLTGGQDRDRIRGQNGDDKISGGPGNDNLNGNNGDDEVNGGEGHDFVSGRDGKDIVTGGPGVDTVLGGGKQDIVKGGPGNDTMSGNGFADQMFGGRGNDTIVGGDGPDHLRGEMGNDSLDGSRGNDILWGGNGTDSCNGRTGWDRQINCETTLSIP